MRGPSNEIGRTLSTLDPVEDVHEIAQFGSYNFWLNVGLTLMCVIMAATAAGLTMGLVSISPLEMQVCDGCAYRHIDGCCFTPLCEHVIACTNASACTYTYTYTYTHTIHISGPFRAVGQVIAAGGNP
jgi:hypothetical protein